MDQTAEVQHQIRRVRRTKAQIAADKAEHSAIVEHVEQHRADIEEAVFIIDRLAQGLALRIWNGQSPDLVRAERIKRVAAGLEEQGLSMDGVELP